MELTLQDGIPQVSVYLTWIFRDLGQTYIPIRIAFTVEIVIRLLI